MGSRIARAAAVGWVFAAAIGAACAGTGARDETPAASLAQTDGAQRAFQPIRERWALADPRERAALEPSLQEFRAQFPTDPLTRLANVYLAWIALERADLETAGQLAENVRKGPAGTTRDLAVLVAATVLCRKGNPEPALDLLTPLVGKLFDPFAQELLHAQLIDATIRTSRWFEALAYMDDWLRSAPSHERDSVRERVLLLLASFPPEPLELSLQSMRSSRQRTGWSEDMRLAITEQLTRVAIKRSDPRLAKTVIETPGAMENLGDAGDTLASLASSGGLSPRVVDAAIGVVLPARNDRLRSRAAEAMAGVVEVFGPGPSTTPVDGGSGIAPSRSPALHARDHRDIAAPSRTPFDEIAHEGAALIVAGFDAESATLASRFAESESIPVILLHAPSQPVNGGRFTFLVGESDESLSRAVMQAAERGGKAARIGGSGSDEGAPAAACDARAARAGEARFPLAAWRKQGITAIALAGPRHCGADVLLELTTQKWEPSLFVGPEAIGLELPRGYRGKVSVAKAGLMGTGRRDAALEAWVRAHGDDPSWWAALGRDAAVLAQAALAVLPQGLATDAGEVARRREAVRGALEAASVALWTTSAAGFGAGRRVERTIVW